MTQPKTGSKFTPGPWKAVSTPITWQIRDAANEVITESWNCHPLPDANARLIAAAPEMYELLSQLLETVDKKFLAGGTPLCDRCEHTLGQSIAETRRIKAAIDGEG